MQTAYVITRTKTRPSNMMEGEIQAIVAGETRTIRAGEAMFLSRGIPHQLINRSGQPAHYTLSCTLSGFEGFVAESGYSRKSGERVQPPTAEDVAQMQDAAPRFGITLLPGW